MIPKRLELCFTRPTELIMESYAGGEASEAGAGVDAGADVGADVGAVSSM